MHIWICIQLPCQAGLSEQSSLSISLPITSHYNTCTSRFIHPCFSHSQLTAENIGSQKVRMAALNEARWICAERIMCCCSLTRTWNCVALKGVVGISKYTLIVLMQAILMLLPCCRKLQRQMWSRRTITVGVTFESCKKSIKNCS